MRDMNKELKEIIRKIPKLPKRTDNFIDQLEDLTLIAKRLGCHDAARILKLKTENYRKELTND
jgi:hypothetical protein